MATSSLLQLPEELLNVIVQATIPEGVESLATTCHALHRLCTPFLKRHNFLRTHFHHFAYNTYPPDSRLLKYNPGAYDLISHIAKDPIIARYITHADLHCDTWPPRARPLPSMPDIDDGGPLVALFANSPALRMAGLEWREYYVLIQEELDDTDRYRYSQHAAAFLLTLLPNLSVATLKLPRHWEASETSDRLIRAIYSSRDVEDIARRNVQDPYPRRSARA